MIIVGARCAGAPTAVLPARHGPSVLLLDRAIFPSDIPHGHFIHRHGPELLADWGLDESLAGYERARDAATIPDFHANLVAAKLGTPPPELLALRAAIRGDEQETRRFFMAHEGREDRAAYFSPENVGRIMATA